MHVPQDIRSSAPMKLDYWCCGLLLCKIYPKYLNKLACANFRPSFDAHNFQGHSSRKTENSRFGDMFCLKTQLLMVLFNISLSASYMSCNMRNRVIGINANSKDSDQPVEIFSLIRNFAILHYVQYYPMIL